MRITAFFLLIAALQVSASSMSQNITFRGKGEVLRNVFQAIEKQTGYVVFYSKNMLQMAKPVDLDVKDMPLNDFLEVTLHNQPLKFVIENRSILISQRQAGNVAPVEAELSVQTAFVPITGLVTDTLGGPLAGATVTVKGTKTTAITDGTGKFTINANRGDVLLISYIGFKKTEVKVGFATTLRIILKQTDNELADVAVVNTGYQTLSQREMASSVVTVKMKDIELNSKVSVDQMLAGQVAGLMSLQSSGEPGATPKIRIRGTSSIIGGSAPLWVLDGIILEDPVNIDLSNLNSPDAQYLVGNAIAGINARDIESISVLKDASATAIYGSRATNGVIVVTTKKGRVGKPQINYSGSLSMSQRPSYGDLNLMNAGEKIQLTQEILQDGNMFSRVPRRLGYEGLYLNYLDNVITHDEFKDKVQKMAENNTDWYDILFRNSLTNNHSVNVSGGSDRTTYYGSIGYTNAQGAAIGSDQKRYSAMMKVNSWMTEKLFVGLQVNASNSAGTGFYNSVNPNKYAYQTARTIPAYNEDGSLFFYETQQKSQEFPAASTTREEMLYNIINERDATGASSDATSLTAQVNVEYRFFKNFRYRFLGGFDQGITNSSSWAEERSNAVSVIRRWNRNSLTQGTPAFEESVLPWGGIISNNDQRKTSYTIRNSMEYNKSVNNVHLINVMAAQEIRSLTYKGISTSFYGWQPERGNTISPALTTGYLSIVNSLRPTITDRVTNYVSWLGSAAYTYKDKLTFNANIRADGSNNFGDNPKYRFLPVWSVAGKYTLSNEAFMMDSKVISYLAVRGSYGIQGNVDKSTSPELIIRVGSREPVTGFNESFYQFLANPDLRWEKTMSYNVGLEFALFGTNEIRRMDVVSGTIDIYDKQGSDIIVTRGVSQVIGLNNVKINGGRVTNRGVEGSLRIAPYQTRDFSLSLRVIASYNKNTLVEANRELNITNNNKLSGNALIEGKPLGSFYSYPYAGLSADYGYPLFYDRKGNLRYELLETETELVYSGVRTPDLSGGFDFNIRYKGWYAGIGFQYASGASERLPDFYRVNYYDVFDALANVSKETNDRWRAPGDEKNTNVPVLYDSDKYSEAKAALNAPVVLGGTNKTPLEMYDRSDLRTAKTDNIRLRNFSLSYLFQRHLLEKLKVQTLSINFQAENLFLFANDAWQGRDPESGGSNTPLPKVYSLGINVGF